MYVAADFVTSNISTTVQLASSGGCTLSHIQLVKEDEQSAKRLNYLKSEASYSAQTATIIRRQVTTHPLYTPAPPPTMHTPMRHPPLLPRDTPPPLPLQSVGGWTPSCSLVLHPVLQVVQEREDYLCVVGEVVGCLPRQRVQLAGMVYDSHYLN